MDTGRRNSFSWVEVDVLHKAQEHHLKTIMEQIEMKIEERLKHQSDSFNHEVKDLRVVSKQWHNLFVEVAKKVEDVNFKVEEICTEMTKEIVKLD